MRNFAIETRRAFTPVACLRMLLLSAAATAVLYVAVEIWLRPALPALQFDWPKAFVTSIVGLLALMVLAFMMQLAIPPIISLTDKGLREQQGEAATLIRLCDNAYFRGAKGD